MNRNYLIAGVAVVAAVALGAFMWQKDSDEPRDRDATAPTSQTALDAAGKSTATLTSDQPSYRVKAADGITTVSYTDKGFVPFIVEVKAGEAVRFINNSSKALWVTSYAHPTAKDQNYPGFDEGKSIARGQSYIFNFTKKGVWGYKNLDNVTDLGTIVVTAQ